MRAAPASKKAEKPYPSKRSAVRPADPGFKIYQESPAEQAAHIKTVSDAYEARSQDFERRIRESAPGPTSRVTLGEVPVVAFVGLYGRATPSTTTHPARRALSVAATTGNGSVNRHNESRTAVRGAPSTQRSGRRAPAPNRPVVPLTTSNNANNSNWDRPAVRLFCDATNGIDEENKENIPPYVAPDIWQYSHTRIR